MAVGENGSETTDDVIRVAQASGLSFWASRPKPWRDVAGTERGWVAETSRSVPPAQKTVESMNALRLVLRTQPRSGLSDARAANLKTYPNKRLPVRILILTFVALSFSLPGADPQSAPEKSSTVNQFKWSGTNFVARGGWGRMIHLSDTHWLCVNTRFGPGESSLEIRVTTNSFHSWTKLSEVAEPGRFMDNGELIQLPGGELLLTGRSLIEGQSYRLPVYRSVDGGKRWTAFSDIDSNEGSPGSLKQRGLWEPHFFLLNDGRLAVAYANEKHASDQPAFSQVCSERISMDGGKTWGDEITLAAEPRGGGLRPGMPVVSRLSNGKFIVVYEVVGVGDADVFCKVSEDGEHWPAGLGNRIAGHHAGPWVTSLASGELLLTSCANRLSWSRDFGRTWNFVEPPAWNVGAGKVFTWPAIYEIATNQIAVMISRRGVQLKFGSKIANGTNPIAVHDH